MTQSTTLPGRYFTDPDVFRREIERFFFGRWICVGRAEQLARPGDYFLCDVAGESIIIVRDRESRIRAFYNVCRHRGTRMCTQPEGTFSGPIRCPYHGWSYALSGALVGAPHMEDAAFRREDYPLHALRADEWEGHLFVNASTPCGPLTDQLSGLTEKFFAWHMKDLRLHRRLIYTVEANWKLIILNYNECLHCPLLHPTLNRLTDYLGADNEPPTPNYIGGSMGFRDGAETMSVDGVRRRAFLPGLSAEQRKVVCYYAIYPNLLLSLHPDYMMTHTLWPRAVDRTEIHCEWHFDANELARSTFKSEDVVSFWDQTNREDWRISELSQAGIGSRAYTPGPYSPREQLLHAFDRIILDEV